MAVISNLKVPPGPAFSTVKLLLASTGGGTITDYETTPKTITSNGSVATSSGVTKFGAKSIDLRTAGAYLSFAASSDFALSSAVGDGGCWEAWIYPASLAAADNIIMDNRINGANTVGSVLFINSSGQLCYYDGTNVVGAAGPVVKNSIWQHVAVSAYDGWVVLWLNGIATAVAASATTTIGTLGLKVGMRNDNTLGLRGYFDQVRVTRGDPIYKYTEIPRLAFPTS